MTAWGLLGLCLALLFVLDGLKMRRRLGALLRVDKTGAPTGSGAFELLLAPGATLDEGVRRAAEALAKEQGLAVLDLVPERWPASRAMGFAQVVDGSTFRRTALAPGFSAGQALLVDRALLARAGLLATAPRSEAAFVELARRLKRYAPTAFDFAICGRLRPRRPSAGERYDLLRDIFLDLTPAILCGQLALLALAVAAAFRGGWPGALGLVALHLQPLVSLAGSKLVAPDILVASLLASPLQLWEWAATIAAARPDPERLAAVEERRQPYEAELARGLPRFFEERRPTCYVCGGSKLRLEMGGPDLLQHKPGRFTLERCLDCGHLFQNPRLSLEGLGFYYRDFYDGLGERWLETIFGLTLDSYLERARQVGESEPRAWLDVGGGYGHFALAARAVWPRTRFDCLDMGESVDEGVRRGWIDRGFRGLLPDLASTLRGEYDVVSLSHCLEHTRDPRAEIGAAKEILRDGGRLLVEVPDPDSVLRKLFRSRWLPYFQPQHQHLLSASNLRRLLEEDGFTVERIDRRAHTGFDTFFAVFQTLDGLVLPELPWRRRQPAWAAPARWLVFAAGAPLFLIAVLCDAAVRSLLAVPGVSNAYRIVARRAPTVSPASGSPSLP
ncbi:MAG: class I SAM-dependent methyltransferase [Myxococcales bacterium]